MPLLWKHIDFERGVIDCVGITKNDDPKRFYFKDDPDLTAALQDQLRYTRKWEKRKGKVIPEVFHRCGKVMQNFPYEAWRKACERAGVLGKDGRAKIPHDNCRSGIRNFDRSGVPKEVTKALTGRKTDEIFRRYRIIDDEDRQDAIAVLAQARKREKGKRKVVPMKRRQA